MKRRLTTDALAVERSLFERRDEVQEASASVRITTIASGDVVEFVGPAITDHVWVKWRNAIWFIRLEAWDTAEQVAD